MILSAFSHSHWLHLTCNMFVAYSFFGGTVDKFLGIDQVNTSLIFLLEDK